MRRLATALSLALLVVLVGCAGTSTRGVSPSPKPSASSFSPTPVDHVVLYELDGSAASANITYQTPTGMSQQQGIDVPMTSKSGGPGLEFKGFGYGDFVYFSAQNDGEYGSLTCRITVDGEVISENTSSGGFAIATCEGRS